MFCASAGAVTGRFKRAQTFLQLHQLQLRTVVPMQMGVGDMM
jgi:hypothetical protein